MLSACSLSSPDAVIFKRAPKKLTATLSLDTCFFDALLALCPESDYSPKLISLREEVIKKKSAYISCSGLLGRLILLLEDRGMGKVMVNVDAKFDSFIETTIVNVSKFIEIFREDYKEYMKVSPEENFFEFSTDDEILETLREYLERFKAYAKTQKTKEMSGLDWLRLSIVFYEDVLRNQINAWVYQDFLRREKVVARLEIRGDIRADVSVLYAALNYYACYQYLAQVCGLVEDVSWQPISSIDVFLSALRKHGPFLVGGFLGDAAYTEPATKQTTLISGMEIWSWKKGTAKPIPAKGAIGEAHAMLAIGASKAGYEGTSQDLVYLRDFDGRVFILSYRRFCESVLGDWCSGMKNTAAGVPIPISYIFYHPETPLIREEEPTALPAGGSC